MKKVCQKCAHYRPFYEKGSFMFWTEPRGFCLHCKKVAGENQSCNFFRPPHQPPSATVEMLDAAVRDVLALKQIYGVED